LKIKAFFLHQNTQIQRYTKKKRILKLIHKSLGLKFKITTHPSRDDDERHVPQIEFFSTRYGFRFGYRRNVNSCLCTPRARHAQTVLRQIHQLQFDVRPETFLVELYLASEPFEVFLNLSFFLFKTNYSWSML